MDYILIMAIAIIGLLIFIVGMIWLLKRGYNYKVRVREITSGDVRIIFDTVGKIKRDKEKIEFLRLWNSPSGHRELPLPPPESVDYDPKKKKRVVEVWWTPEEGYSYISDGKKEEIRAFEPLTTKQRSMLINQIRKKEARKIKTWQENIPLIIGVGAIIILVAIILLFWGEFMKPFMAAVDRVELLMTRANLCGATTGSQVIQ